MMFFGFWGGKLKILWYDVLALPMKGDCLKMDLDLHFKIYSNH